MQHLIVKLIHYSLIENGYVKRGELTEKYYEAKKNGTLVIADEVAGQIADVVAILDSVYDSKMYKLENVRKNTVEARLDKKKLNSETFQKMWSHIKNKSYYSNMSSY